MFLPLPQEPDLFTLSNDSKELAQEQSFFMKGEMHKIGQAILCCSKTCCGYYISFSVIIPSGQSMSLFKMDKRVHCASKVSSKSCPPGLMCWDFAVHLSFRQDAFTDKCPHPALKLSCVPPLWLFCNPQYIFPTGVRAQQL